VQTAAQRNNGNVRNNSGHTFSIIASDVEIVGNLNARVDLHIDGKIQGDVTCGNLVQGEGSIIAGKVIAESARLSGSVEGSIEANDLVIESTARITGDVVYTNLTIAPGGQIEGKFRHKSSGGAPSISRTTVDISKVSDPLILGTEAKVA
jgi:cytoskeletal protein CcmA (bactofilin family)